MISSFSQEQFQQFYEFSGGGGGGDNRKVPHFLGFFLHVCILYNNDECICTIHS